MIDGLLCGEFLPTSEAELQVGQTVFDARTNTDMTITEINRTTIMGQAKEHANHVLRPLTMLKKSNLHWVGTHWIHLPRPWLLTVEDWDGKTFIAQFHDSQAELMVEASSEKEAVLKFPKNGTVTLFRLRRMLIRLDAVALVSGLKSDLGENGPFGSTLDLLMSQPTLKETFSPKIKNTLIDELEKAWDRAAPEGVWWAVGGQGETWCCDCTLPALRCSCGGV